MSGVNNPVYVLRTCKEDLTDYKGFQWPESGYVESADWDPEVDHSGLYGLFWGSGFGGVIDWFPEAKWLVIRVDGTIRQHSTHVEFQSGYVEHCGDQKSATDFIMRKGAQGPVVGATVSVGDLAMAVSGCRGSATSGKCGVSCTGDYGTSVSGIGGRSTSGYHGVSVADNYGYATAGSGGSAKVGVEGFATVGCGGSASAGERGKISIEYWDSKVERSRVKIGYIGEDGLEPDVLYTLEESNNFIAVSTSDPSQSD
jgi:hypothetical protein